LEAAVVNFRKKLPMLERSISIRYQIYRWAFVIGVVSLIASRGILGIDKIQARPEKAQSSTLPNPIISQKPIK
jgi:hypothetical protein